MTFAYDNYILLPTKDLYDSAIMKIAIDAAKDIYDKGENLIKEFYKDYGDFTSPFAKDMARYGEMIGSVRNIINDAYANGVDLLKTPQGRAIISQAINKVNPAEFNNMRANAKMGYEYLKSIREAEAKNQFNPEFENWILTQKGGPGLFSEFSSEGGKVWDRSTPYTYLDLNQYTGHIFDKMEDSFIETGPDHYDYYGVSRELRAKALTDNLAGLLSTPLGKFHYEKAREHAAMLGKDPNDESAVMDQFQNDILTSTTEYEHRNRKLNEMWKLQYEDASRQRAAARSSASPQSNQNAQWSFAELVRRAGSTAVMGQLPQEYSLDTLNKQRDRQIEIGIEISKNNGYRSYTDRAQLEFKKVYGQNQYRQQDVSDFIVSLCGWQKLKDDPTTLIIDSKDIDRFHTLQDVSSHTVGYRGKQVGTNNTTIQDGDYVLAKATGGSYQAFMKDARHKNYFEFNVKVYKKVPVIDKDGNAVYDPDTKLQKTELKLVSNTNRYFDSHITSTQNDPRSGYLGTVNKKTGKVITTKGIATTNTQDYKYSDAVIADKYVTDDITKGTIYGSDATITELPNFANTKIR